MPRHREIDREPAPALTLRAFRRRLNLSQVALAARANLFQETISQLELCKVRNPSYETVAALATALATTPDHVAAMIRSSRPPRKPQRGRPSRRRARR